MTASVYPATGRWHELTPLQQAERLDVAEDLLNVLQHWRGDERLNPWEEGFLTSLVRLTQEFGGKAKISPKQWDVLRRILDKMDAPDEPEDELHEAEGD